MKIYTIILTMMLIPVFGFASCENAADSIPHKNLGIKIVPDTTIEKILGDTIVNLLFSPKKVTVYMLANREPDKEKHETEVYSKYVRDSLLTVLKQDIYSVLQFNLLADSANYKTDFDRVKSPYRPLLEFEFSIKKDSASVLVSFSDFSWAVIYHGREICRFNYENRHLMRRYKQLILNK